MKIRISSVLLVWIQTTPD